MKSTDMSTEQISYVMEVQDLCNRCDVKQQEIVRAIRYSLMHLVTIAAFVAPTIVAYLDNRIIHREVVAGVTLCLEMFIIRFKLAVELHKVFRNSYDKKVLIHTLMALLSDLPEGHILEMRSVLSQHSSTHDLSYQVPCVSRTTSSSTIS